MPRYASKAFVTASQQPPALIFTQFSHLPRELQLKIWDLALRRPRRIDIFTNRYEPLEPCPEDDHTEETPFAQTHFAQVFARPRDMFNIFHACHDSRNFLLQKYIPFHVQEYLPCRPGTMKKRKNMPPVALSNDMEPVHSCTLVGGHKRFEFLDLRNEVLYLVGTPSGGYPVPGYRFTEAKWCTLWILTRWLSSDIKEKLCTFAMSIQLLRTTARHGALSMMVELKGLEVLYVCFQELNQGNAGPGCGRALTCLIGILLRLKLRSGLGRYLMMLQGIILCGRSQW